LPDGTNVYGSKDGEREEMGVVVENCKMVFPAGHFLFMHLF